MERAVMCEAAPQRGFLTRIKALQMLIDVRKVLPVTSFVLYFNNYKLESVRLRHVWRCIYSACDEHVIIQYTEEMLQCTSTV